MLYVTPPSGIGYGPTAATGPGSAARESEALKQYEQLFLFQLLKEMRKTVPDYGALEGGSQKAYFEELMDDFLAGEMAASGQLGVAEQMASQLHLATKVAEIPDGAGFPIHSPTPAGIAVRSAYSGSTGDDGRSEGIEIPPAPVGIPRKTGTEAGISLRRAHAHYQESQ